jgi:hypothetical protein
MHRRVDGGFGAALGQARPKRHGYGGMQDWWILPERLIFNTEGA